MTKIATPVRVERDERQLVTSQAYDVLGANGKYVLTRVSEDLARRFTFWANNHEPLVEALGCTAESLSTCKRQFERLRRPFIHDVELNVANTLLDRIDAEGRGGSNE